MGDDSRFELFARLIEQRYPDKNIHIADVAGGKGGLQVALHNREYCNVTTFDKRRKRIRKAGMKASYRTKWFDGDNCRLCFDLIVGMHPDEATDHIIVGASKLNIPFIVCPCCIKPDAVLYRDCQAFNAWYGHLKTLAHRLGFKTEDYYLKIRGRNKVLIGTRRACLCKN